MEELTLLRQLIQERNYHKALEIVDELEEMSREDKLNKIYSYGVILLLHLIKQEVEKRTTRSWEFSIYNASKNIKRVNKRRKSGGCYANQEELLEILTDAFETALKKAALEALEGRYTDSELKEKIDEEQIKEKALGLIC
ncbi:MAG: DUF29 domain-containing protein [Moorea sp. SIOASIH]|uniref:DUF29 family protein n=1 Tax=Moorena sp. SIOASIH TaxID=2607817 RepID=UPI0013BBBBE1|nr:DUF29 family protein [Moorena sp. SIOASIH]NEO36193.1 DUF29 domain-containing protein [Moorena sp. SIOASIH]